ncbi:MAG: NAD(P)-dependent oxidoreductase [Phycisphaerae bacterium]
MKILVACKLPEFAIEELQALGSDVIVAPTITTEQLVTAIRDVNILVVRRNRVTAEVLHAQRQLQMILRAGTDVTNIAIEEASAQGVFVVRCPNRDSVAVAEMAFTLLLALDRRLPDAIAAARSGNATQRDEVADAHGLAGATLGLVGYGPTQREIAARARAFGMKILSWSPSLSGEQATDDESVQFVNWPRELAARSDAVIVYAPPHEGEELRADAELLGAMRERAAFVHIGVPAAISESAIADAIDRRHIRVALDLFSPRETERVRCPLAERPDVLATFRLADRSRHAKHSIATEVVSVVRQFLVSGTVANCVNLLERSPATWQLVLRLRDAVGVMASIMDAVRADGVNAEEITSRVFVGARAAWCTIALDERPSAEALQTIRAIEGVLHLELRAVV